MARCSNSERTRSLAISSTPTLTSNTEKLKVPRYAVWASEGAKRSESALSSHSEDSPRATNTSAWAVNPPAARRLENPWPWRNNKRTWATQISARVLVKTSTRTR